MNSSRVKFRVQETGLDKYKSVKIWTFEHKHPNHADTHPIPPLYPFAYAHTPHSTTQSPQHTDSHAVFFKQRLVSRIVHNAELALRGLPERGAPRIDSEVGVLVIQYINALGRKVQVQEQSIKELVEIAEDEGIRIEVDETPDAESVKMLSLVY
jgi:hypothetical protein